MRRDVEDDAIGIAELVLGILGDVRRGAGMILAAVGFNRLLHRIYIIHPNAEVMQADKVLAALVAGVLLSLKLQQSNVHHPVRKPRRNPRLGDALEAERRLVEPRRLLLVGHRDRNMPELAVRHGTPPFDRILPLRIKNNDYNETNLR